MSRTLLSCLGLGLAVCGASATLGVSSIGATGAVILGGIAGNSAHDLCKLLSAKTADRFFDGRSAVDENHIVVKQLRLAQLRALAVTLDRFDLVWAVQDDRVNAPIWAAFSERMRQFLREENDFVDRLAFAGPDDDPAAERQIRAAVLSALPATLDESLAARRESPSEPERRAALLESVGQLRAALERAVLAELKLRTELPDLPSPFFDAFCGEGQPDAWFDLFVRDAAARLRQDTEFHRIWTAEEGALLRSMSEAHAATLAGIDRRTEHIAADLAELLTIARSGGAFQRAAAEGISEAAVRRIVERLGGKGLSAADLVLWLDNWIEAARRELGYRTNEDEAFEAARLEAERLFREGYVGASSVLMDELAREGQREAERHAEGRRRQIRLIDEAIRLDELQLDAGAAVDKLRLKFALEGVADAAYGEWLYDQARDFADKGYRVGSSATLLVAIAASRVLLSEWPRQSVPLYWAAAQHNLGVALSWLGERERGTTTLMESIAAYRSALEVYSRVVLPLEWATTQDCLASALCQLGQREGSIEQLKQALSAHRSTLAERTRESVPFEWALTQINIGATLKAMGDIANGTGHLEQAVTSYRAALEELKPEGQPLEWARAQSNLGAALKALGDRADGITHFQEAIAAYNEALTVRTRNRVPLNWARTQNNLANALSALGRRTKNEALLVEAVQMYRLVLEEWTRERVPLDWAMAQNNLAGALQALGEGENGTERLRQAIDALQAALEERTRERVPLDWAMTQNNLGGALKIIGRRLTDMNLIKQSIATHRAALEERTRKRTPLDWAMSQSDLGEALQSLGEIEVGTISLKEAVDAFRFAAEIYSIELFPSKRTNIDKSIAACQILIAKRQHPVAASSANAII